MPILNKRRNHKAEKHLKATQNRGSDNPIADKWTRGSFTFEKAGKLGTQSG